MVFTPDHSFRECAWLPGKKKMKTGCGFIGITVFETIVWSLEQENRWSKSE